MARRALVTGAARGIGAAIAERLRNDGLEVTTLDRDEGCDLRLDLSSDELPDLTGIDVCVSNAAITDTLAPAHRMSPEQWSATSTSTLTGAFPQSGRLPGCASDALGRIVAISSGAAGAGAPRPVACCPQGGAARNGKTLAAENAHRGITTAQCCRGW
jgi:NAD(P)-dependent dehydrogenase (short-subunit alcohol dehydrogenase family)